MNMFTDYCLLASHWASYHMWPICTTMGPLDTWRIEYLPRLRNLLCRSDCEESHHVLHQFDMVKCPQRPRDRCLPAIIPQPVYHNWIQPRSEDHCSLWGVAKDQEQGRRGERGSIPWECQDRPRGIWNRPRDEPSRLWRTARPWKAAHASMSPRILKPVPFFYYFLHKATAYSGVLFCISKHLAPLGVICFRVSIFRLLSLCS